MGTDFLAIFYASIKNELSVDLTLLCSWEIWICRVLA